MTDLHPGICNLCDATCGILIQHEGGRILGIRGDKEDPFSRGHICPKAVALKDVYEDPDRLRRPVRRIGERWEPISWDDALAEVATRVVQIQRTHGADAVGLYFGNPMGHSYQAMLALLALVRYLGTKNIFSSSSVDSHPRTLVSMLLYGNQALLPVPDIERTDHLVVMGANPVISNGSVMTAPDAKRRLERIRARGGKVIVIDPRRTETAELSDQHHFIRPGTDALLLLAVLHLLHHRGRLDAQKHSPLVRGLPELITIVERFPPSRVAERVGIAVSAIEQLATEFAAARSAVWYGRMGTSTQQFGCLATWLIDVINIVTGNFDRPGGAMFTTPAVDLAGLARSLGESGKFNRWQSRVGGLSEFNGEFPVAALADEIETPGRGQLRAFLTIAGNPVLSNPNGRRLDTALQRLDFMAAIDFYINETTRHAHIILPPATVLESDHYPLLEYAMAVRNTARYARAVFPAQAQAQVRPDFAILTQLLARIGRERGGLHALAPLGAKALAAAISSGAALDLLLRLGPHRMTLKELRRRPHGIDLGPLKPRIRQVLGTPDKRIHLVPTPLAKDIARLEAPLAVRPAADALAKDSPEFSLVSRRTLRSMNSWLNNSPRLAKGPSRCTLAMHPSDAARLGLINNRHVELSSRVGTIRAVVEVSDEMMPGVVSLPYGWGHDRPGARLTVARQHAGVSMNDLTDERLYDHVSGTTVLDGIPVTIRGICPPAPELADPPEQPR